jgi:hypothetical protein
MHIDSKSRKLYVLGLKIFVKKIFLLCTIFICQNISLMNNLIYIDNNWDVQSFSCEWQTINISWNAVFDWEETYNIITPILNYIDQDNQVISEEYNNNQLYLSWKYIKTYTWWSNNYYLLTPYIEETEEITHIVYTPTFDVTWTTQEIGETWNIFNNFSDNALKVLLSNIPSYIQYVTIFLILIFLFSFLRRFKRK